MARPRKYVRDANGRTVDGVSYHQRGGFYIIRPDDQERDYFGKGPGALEEAKRRYDELNGFPKYLPPRTADEVRSDLQSYFDAFEEDDSVLEKKPDVIERLKWTESSTEAMNLMIDLGVDADWLKDDPDWLAKYGQGGRRINPEWARQHPDDPQTWPLGIPPEKWKTLDQENTHNPRGERLSLAQVGELYLEWYAQSRCDVDVAKQQADAYNAEGDRHNATVDTRIGKGNQAKVATKSLRRRPRKHWLDFVKPSVKKRSREHQKYYREFTDFIANAFGEVSIAQLKGDHFLAYNDHVHQVAKRKRNLKNPELWRNHRFEAVRSAFNRVKKRKPDAAWAKELFGEGGYLSILETKAPEEGAKTLITPAEFRAIVNAADIQWKAILYLSMNCALQNADVCEIEWRHIDLEHRLLRFPRGKTKQPRITPLASATVDALRSWRKQAPTSVPIVFVTWQGARWTTKGIGDHWDDLRIKVEQQTSVAIPATFKSLRKTTASTVQDELKNDVTVRVLLGQKSKGALRHYVNNAPGFLHDAVAVIEKAYF